MKKYRRLLLLGAIAALVVLFFATGLHEYLSLAWIKARQAFLLDLYERRPVFVVAAFSAVYIPVVAFNLPGGLVLGLAAGALFGTLTGTIIVSFTSSVGATLSCLLSRYLLRNTVQRRFGEKLHRVNAGIREEGAFYLFALRLMPVIPFFVINMVMGLTTMPLSTFYLVSQLGMLPGTAVFVHAGSQLGRIDSLSGILSPGVILSLSLVGIFPLAVRRGINFLRGRYRRNARPESSRLVQSRFSIPSLQTIREKCTQCGICREACGFLAKYGQPKRIATDFNFFLPGHQAIAYECSLCGLCTALCPERLDPARLFLEIRRRCVEDGHFDPSPYRTILRYEKIGVSPFFSWYGLPEGCDTVFFPGCTLPGTRPAVTLKMYRQLQEAIPALGIVLDCCAKPSHDLGRTDFHSLFIEMNDYLAGQGVRSVLTACPGCTKMFRQYGQGFAVRTVYEILHENFSCTAQEKVGIAVGVHDPCALREDISTHQAVRGLLSGLGYTLVEMEHRQQQTLCCGEGGTVGAVNPALARAWATKRGRQAVGDKMITYCAGCVGYLNRVFPTVHIADLLYRPEAARKGKLKIARAPLTYWNRICLKRRMKKEIRARVWCERPAAAEVKAGIPN